MLDEILKAMPVSAAETEDAETAAAEAATELAAEEGDDAVPRGCTSRAETRVAIIGHPNVGKSTLLNVLTGTSRAIVSPIAGTTRDAIDELIEKDGHTYRFIDTAGIRRKGKTT